MSSVAHEDWLPVRACLPAWTRLTRAYGCTCEPICTCESVCHCSPVRDFVGYR
ncbi:hypothetical protein COLSTE_00597 [Collinsella stercoris DSM 13279]|uniref:Uncharacterized protein n=1 Tax=Collinsella stercoris DSM 13279 TaxID=445975 RepID=B6G956_9ACTN|nr:hypothetical protein COLSTE_00597 [Collinsella stercoris DSM 13279]